MDDFKELINIREYINQVLDDIWYGRIKMYPKDFEEKCSRDEVLTEKLFEKFGRAMGFMISYLKIQKETTGDVCL